MGRDLHDVPTTRSVGHGWLSRPRERTVRYHRESSDADSDQRHGTDRGVLREIDAIWPKLGGQERRLSFPLAVAANPPVVGNERRARTFVQRRYPQEEQVA